MRWAALVAVVALACAGCGGGDDAPTKAQSDVTICMYTHGNSGEFWSTVKHGAQQAAADLGVTLDYQEADGDGEAQAHLMEAGIAAGCAGMAVSAADPTALQAAADQVHAADIPLVVLNAGATAYDALHAFTFVGQDGAVAGRRAGDRLTGLGVTKVLCVEQDEQDPSLDHTCAAAQEAFGAVETLSLPEGVADLPASETAVQGRLAADPSIDAVLSLDPALAVGSVLPAVQAVGRTVTVGTVGVSVPAVQAVKAGTLAFAMDEEPYVEGYLPVVLLDLHVTDAAEPGGGAPMYSGPSFVTQADADRFLQLAAAGAR